MFLFKGFSMRLCHYGLQKLHSLLTLVCIYSTVFVLFTLIFEFILENVGIGSLQASVPSDPGAQPPPPAACVYFHF